MTTAVKSMKRIHKVTVKRMFDECPDTSWLGEYSDKRTSDYSIDRAHSQDCQSIEANHREAVDKLEHAIDYLMHSEPESDFYDDDAVDVLREKQDELQECDCDGGDMERHEYRYFNPSFNYVDKNGNRLLENTDEEVRKYVRQDYERMERLQRGDWCFVGIRAEAEVSIPSGQGHATIQRITSSGLWGIESDSDASYFKDIEQEQLSELREQLHAIGFSSRAISAAFKQVEHKDC